MLTYEFYYKSHNIPHECQFTRKSHRHYMTCKKVLSPHTTRHPQTTADRRYNPKPEHKEQANSPSREYQKALK